MQTSQEFFVHIENICAFVRVLEECDMNNGINYAEGDDTLSINVWYYPSEEAHIKGL